MRGKAATSGFEFDGIRSCGADAVIGATPSGAPLGTASANDETGRVIDAPITNIKSSGFTTSA
jgi:hypothetical protein